MNPNIIFTIFFLLFTCCQMNQKEQQFRFEEPELKPPKLLEKPEIILPDSLRKENLKEIVLIKCLIDTLGRVKKARILKSSNPRFNSLALKSVEQYKFAPGELNKKKVNCFMIISIKF